ncbi:glycoside hydrolase family 3 N-terminal domain-containing protein [Paenibacillus sp. LHD-117]|uniref:glycoside hydrolase family 3 N-terminal domain-containing protein n=1 Tax=Paenibacillus sp. LHD-117 TaxID=3071412 RepID=UPI0027E1B572|nr:glycoside hydrolase family 3 N-terminal domain-containing protein [Paenibacillus sp. LHD-117]MDQ6417835.1 glycoside hydrolase family 3 N-terminal domain-containing protein [Paenibacillus sp. LHD-117]
MEKYKQTGLPIEERVADLMTRMTLREKVGQLNQRMYGWDAYEKQDSGAYALTDAFKEEVAAFGGMGALYGLFRSDPWSGVDYANGIVAQDSAAVANEIQRYVKENTRLGIPVLLSEECPHGHQALDGTMLPVNLNVGSTWNPELMERAYSQTAAEIRSRGAHLGLISVLDIMQDPRWGRSEECFGEDPYLAAAFTQAAVRGMQGDRELAEEDKVAVVLKHLSAQGAGIGGKNAAPASIGERELREIHLPAAMAGAKAGAAGFMAAYNEIDGIPCHANSKLLTHILRDEWGFEGIVMADGQAIDRLLALTGGHEAAAALALTSGVDLSLWDKSFTTLEAAVLSGLVAESFIDRAVARVLRLKFEIGLFDRPYTNEAKAASVVGSPAMRSLNLSIARESVVLLKNDNAALPLKGKGKRIAVIGPNADRIYNQLGDYTSVQRPKTGSTVLEGIRMAAPAGTDIVYAHGCGIRSSSIEGIAEAVAVAQDADVAVLVLGGSSTRQFGDLFDGNGEAVIGQERPAEMDCGEGVDLADLRLGEAQIRLAEAVAATGTPIVIVLVQGRPHAIGEVNELADAVLCAWYPGKEGGQAIGEILFGQVNPSGKLSVSLPRSSAQLPVYYNQKDPGRPRMYVDMTAAPLYSFGHGLSYTKFEYRDLSLSATRIAAGKLTNGERIEVTVKVKNAGVVDGLETVQLYIKARESVITRRIAELKGFVKIALQPGEEREVRLQLGADELGIWDSSMTFAVQPCKVEIQVGGGLRDVLKAELTIL